MISTHKHTLRLVLGFVLALGAIAPLSAQLTGQFATPPAAVDQQNYGLIVGLPYMMNATLPARSQYLVPGLEVRDLTHQSVRNPTAFERRIRRLDAQGRVTETLAEAIALRYDRNGRLLEMQMVVRDEAGRTQYDETWRFNYAQRGASPVNADFVGAAGVSGVIQFNYDSSGRLTRISRTDGYAVSHQEEVRYESGKPSERVIRIDDRYTERRRYLYDAAGALRAVRITIDAAGNAFAGWWSWE